MYAMKCNMVVSLAGSECKDKNGNATWCHCLQNISSIPESLDKLVGFMGYCYTMVAVNTNSVHPAKLQKIWLDEKNVRKKGKVTKAMATAVQGMSQKCALKTLASTAMTDETLKYFLFSRAYVSYHMNEKAAPRFFCLMKEKSPDHGEAQLQEREDMMVCVESMINLFTVAPTYHPESKDIMC